MPTSLGTIVGASPLNVDDGTYLNFTYNTATETLTTALGDTPSDFLTMDSGLQATVIHSISQALSNDTIRMGYRIMNGTTVLAAQDAGGGWVPSDPGVLVTSVTDVTYGGGPQTFAYVNQTANKATWDGASIEIKMDKAKSGGWDPAYLRVDYFAITGTYTASITPTVVDTSAASSTFTSQATTTTLGVVAVTTTEAAAAFTARPTHIHIDYTIDTTEATAAFTAQTTSIAVTATTVDTTEATAAFSAQATTITAGAVTKTTTQATAAFSAQTTSIAVTATTVDTTEATAAFTSQATTSAVGAVTKSTTQAIATFIAQVTTANTGQTVIGTTVASAAFTSQATTPALGSVTKTTTQATAAFAAQITSPDAGEATSTFTPRTVFID